MISLAQRVRDFRYCKGWGPDELASRAEISRTALYQIESGKTGLPRAGTLRRIAVALDVSMDDLLGHADGATATNHRLNGDAGYSSRTRDLSDWMPGEGGPLSLPSQAATSHFAGLDEAHHIEPRISLESVRRSASAIADGLLSREGELMSKLHDLLHSPMGSGIARIIDDLHTMLPRARTGS